MNSNYKDYPQHLIDTKDLRKEIAPLGESVEFLYKDLKELWNHNQINSDVNEPKWREKMHWILMRKMDKLSWNIYRIFTGKKSTIDVVEVINYYSREMSSFAKYAKFLNSERISNKLFTVIKYLSEFIAYLSKKLP